MHCSRTIPVPVALAAITPVAIGGIVAARSGELAPLAATPAIVFGVAAITAPALYIAITAAGNAPPLGGVARAMVAALGAFGIALAGLVLPAAFLAASSTSLATALDVATAALVAASLLAIRRLRRELEAVRPSVQPSLVRPLVFASWAIATLGIAGHLWWSVAQEVMS